MNAISIKCGLFMACLLGAAATASAIPTVIFSDNFNGENGGVVALDYSGFLQWGVSGGTVDLIGAGVPFTSNYNTWDFPALAGNGLYVDLDGSTGAAGTMTSVGIPVTPGWYTVSFDLAGSQRPGYDSGNSVAVSVDTGFASGTFFLNTLDPFNTYALSFSVGSAQNINLVFHNAGGDNVGAILDNVKVTRLPEGGLTTMLLGMSMMALGFVRRMLK